MTLKEKIKPYMYCYLGSGMLTNTYNREVVDKYAEEVEKISDEFTKDFYKWVQVCKKKGRPYDFDNVDELLKTLTQYP